MKSFRIFLGVALIVHGLAHASAGMWATDIGGRTIVTVLWEGATVGFIAAGAGLFGVGILRRWWRELVVTAALSSLTLLLLYSHPLFIAGMAADFVLTALALAPAAGGELTTLEPVRRWVRLTLVSFLLYVAAVIGLRPWHSSWGATRSEQQMVLVGDPPLGQSHYRIDHAVTIRAQADSIWPLITQIGQDRAGVGWKVTKTEPGRVLVLENWGAFVLEPLDNGSTRMHVRTRGEGIPTLSGIVFTPLRLLVFEPAHFIMERRMMLGIKRRAEKRS